MSTFNKTILVHVMSLTQNEIINFYARCELNIGISKVIVFLYHIRSIFTSCRIVYSCLWIDKKH